MKRLFVFIAISGVLVFSQTCLAAPKVAKNTAAAPAQDSELSQAADSVSAAQAQSQPAAEAIDTAAGLAKPAEAAGPATVEDLKKTGDKFAKKGLTAKAVEAYRQCIDLGGIDTANSRMALIVGKTCYAEKKYEDVLRYFSMVSGKNIETPAFKLMLGCALQMTGKNDSAIALLEPVASNQKIPVASRKDMFKVLGDAYMVNKKDDIAAAWYGKYVRSGGLKTADIAYLVAMAEAKTAPAKAVLLFDGNIRSFPSDYRNYLQLGKIQSKNKATLERAVGLLKKAVSIADTVPSAWAEIGNVYERIGKTEEAIDAYRNTLRLDEGNLGAKMSLGALLLDKGSTEEAIGYLEKAHQQVPDSIGPMTLLASAYTRSAKPKKAIELLEKIKAAKPADVTVRKQLVDAYQSSGQDQKAFEEVSGVLEIERDREGLFPYAKMLEKMGRYDEAVAALEEILGVAPDDFEALMALASIYRQQKKLEEAISVYKDLGSIDPKYAPALFERAEVHLEQGKVKWAEMFYQRALAADPQLALAEVGLAKLSLMFNKRDEVEQHIAKAEAIAGDDPAVKKAIEKLRNPDRSSTRSAIQDQQAGSDDAAADDNKDSGKKNKKKRKK